MDTSGSTNSTTEEGKELADPRELTDVGDDPLRPLVLGGDHSISYPIVRAVSEKLGGPFDILHLDAHPDIYDAFEGNKYSHAYSFARIMEGGYAAIACNFQF
ncbi:arginase 1, mitochondrial [Senna tora]|uniref:Arginase 1, mitochondrial n=1 Tax=Senna tora TaxID=362788 RepID=A0A834TTD9_9FABA|nr:arginase 1, mitochondrial [Senna tora]